ncbi:endo-1,4-beta-xylanase [Microbacterium ulmi]|nr:endo-1,4-beta-xylanase [Microbacterium ulmi]
MTTRVLAGIVAASSLLLAPIVAPAALGATPTPVTAVDFQDGTTGTWTKSGSPTLAVVDDPAGGAGNKVLSVADRVAGHDTIQSPTGIFETGVTYTLSARVLVPGTASPHAHFTVKDGYTWAGDIPVPADTWTTVSATYTADADDTQVYFEVDAATPAFYLDDVTVTKPGDAPSPTDPTVPDGQKLVSWSDFEGSTVDPWSVRGSGALALDADAHSGAQALKITGRTDGWNSPKLPGALLTTGTYHISAWVKLVAGQPAAKLNVGINQPGAANQYAWVGSRVDVTDAAWVQIGGDYTVDPATAPTEIYIESDSATAEYLVDDVLITTPLPEPTVTTVVSSDFEGATTDPWFVRGSGALALDADAHSGAQALKITGRTASWNSPAVPGALFTTGTYHVSGWVKLAAGQEPAQANFGAEQKGASNEYPWIGSRVDVTDSAWVQIGGDFTVDPDHLPQSIYIETTSATAEYLIDDVLITQDATGPGGPVQEPGTVLVDSSFDDGSLGAWTARQGSESSSPTVGVVAGGALDTANAAQVSDRTHEGDGIQLDVKDVLLPGQTYALEAYVRFAPGSELGRGLTVSMRTVSGTSSPSFSNLIQVENATATGWTKVSGTFTVPGYDTNAELYFEARYNSGNTSTFLVDQVKVWVPEPEVVDTSLVPLKDTVDFPVGVAIDQRETTGQAAKLLLHHFDQITAENHMKVEAWYDADKQFARNAQATALLDFAQENDLRVYGHVLVWHSQTPAWFFQDDSGRELTSSDADKQLLRDRLKTHIDDIAKSIHDDYGAYGSETNPIVAWDVVNEVVADQATPDGLRTSRWYQVLGEEYIHLAFEYADEAFNGTYAASGADRPVKLFINDYNTEQALKGQQYEALVKRLLAAGVPVDGVGHQFHLSITSSVASLKAALDRFAGLGLAQEVTEMDVTINPADEPNRIKQGYFYRDAFAVFRDYEAAAPASEKLFSVTLWGLTDNRSWRSTQQPLLFGGDLQAKPAYFGAVGDAEGLPGLINTANVFGGDVALDDGFENAVEWKNLPENTLTGEIGGFQARWAADHLTVLVRSTVAADRVEFAYGDQQYVYDPASADSVPGIETEIGGTHYIAVHLPHTGVAAGGSADFDVRVVAGGSVAGAWNTPGDTGRLTFLEPLSTLDIPEAADAPVVDAAVDGVWADAAVASTAKTIEGNAEGAAAEVRTLWKDNTLYALFQVTDPVIDKSNSDPWNQDSVELFLDLGNSRSGAYGPNDTQIRVTTENKLTFGTGDAALQQARVLSSATALTDTGYVVELAIALNGQSGGQSDVPLGGAGTFHGIDFQVNDGRAGSRYSVHTWAEPTGTGYQNTARWGAAQLVAADVPTVPTPPVAGDQLPAESQGDITAPAHAEAGSQVVIDLGTANAGRDVDVWLYSDPYLVFSGTVPANGRITVTLPADLPLGEHRIAAFDQADDSLLGWTSLTVVVPLANVQAPAVTGDIVKNETVTASPGVWSVEGATFAYQWLIDGKPVKKATGATYKIQGSDVGKKLSVIVTATVEGLDPVSATSAAVKVLDKKPAAPLTNVQPPTVEGDPVEGSTVSANPGVWSIDGACFTYQWLIDGKPVKKATGATYKLQGSDVGKKLSVIVTATVKGRAPVSATSAAVTVIAKPKPVLTNIKAPTITGDTVKNATVKANPGTWSVSGATFAYQWLLDGKPIKKATSATYKISGSDVGRKLSVTVTATVKGAGTASATSTAEKVLDKKPGKPGGGQHFGFGFGGDFGHGSGVGFGHGKPSSKDHGKSQGDRRH